MNGSGNVRLWIQGGSTPSIIYGGSVTDGNWHHIVATRNGTSGMSKIYVDGILKGQTTATFTENFSSPTANVQIGSWTGSSFVLQGSLDELAVHNAELLPAEIIQHYTNGTHAAGYYSDYTPVITSIAPLDGIVGQSYSYDVNADSYTTPTYSLTTFPAGMTINATTGLIEWTPAPGDGGMDHNVTVEVSNGVTPVATQSFIITVPAAIIRLDILLAFG